MLSQDITSLCPYHPHPPTYIHNCVSPAFHQHVPSPSPASSIHRSQGPRGGSWEISPLLPPPSQLSKSGTTLSGPSLSSHFFPQAHCLRADTPTALPGSVPWLPLGPSFNLFVTPPVLESSPNRNCVSQFYLLYLLFTNPHHPEDSLKFQAIQLIYVSHSASSHISLSTTPNFRVL